MQCIKQSNIEIVLVGLIFATLILKENINSIFLLAYIFFWLKEKKYNELKEVSLKRFKYYLLFVGSYFLIIFIGIFNSTLYEESTNFLLKQLTILLVPILLINIKWTANKRILLNKIFLLASFLFVLSLYINVIIEYFEIGSFYITDPLHPSWKYYLFTSGRLSPEVHPTYLSVYLVYNIIFIFFMLKKKSKLRVKLIYFLFLILFGMTLIFLSSRGVLLSFFIVFAFYEFYRLIVKKNIYSLIFISILSFLLATVFFGSSQILKRSNKLKKVFNKDYIEIANYNNSLGDRMQINLIAFHTVQNHFWFGIGTKNWEILNKDYYEEYFRNDFEYKIQNLNTHNQYLNSLVSWGIVGLISFLGIIFFQLYFSSKLKNKSLFVFWAFFSIVLLTENMLDRHRGVMFFSVLSGYTIAIYYTQIMKEKEEVTNNLG